MPIDAQKAIADIDAVLGYKVDYGGTAAVSEFAALVVACIERWAPPGSSYRRMLASVEVFPTKYQKEDVRLRSILSALRRDYDQGHVATFEEMVHAAVFDDLLAQAEYYVDEGHLLPAAVVSGAALEEHMRQLAKKHGLPTATTSAKGKSQPRKAAELNDDLHKATAYAQPEWRQVQVWLDLRNEAAHGKPEFKARTEGDIRPMAEGIRAFLAKHPA
jgi:hypothetical protein